MKSQKSRILGIVTVFIMTLIIAFVALDLYDDGATNAFSDMIQNLESIRMNRLLSEENSLIILSPAQSYTETDEPVISIEGYCLPDKKLTVNAVQVNIREDGSFNYEFSLVEGENIITVTNGKATFTYTVKYKFSVIKEYSPRGNLALNGGMMLDISAKALTGAKVYAIVGNSTVNLTADKNSNEIFKSYTGYYSLPNISDKKETIHKIYICAEFGNHKEKIEAGSLTVLKSRINEYTVKNGEGDIINPEISSDGVVRILSPKTDHSNGMASMCIVKKNYAEIVPAQTADDRSDPRYSPFLAGTVDYITGECKFDDQEYYTLLSGVKIDKKNVDAFTGYIMPMNTVSSVNANGSTLTLTMNWKVPFVSEIKEQSYFTGHASRAFNVKAFTSSYIDFVFKYTNAASPNVSFPSSTVVSHARWLDIGKDGTSTLRVFLRNRGTYYGYKAYYSPDNRLVIAFKEKPVNGNTLVAIDVGHGGKDCGAIGANGVYESEINMKIANEIRNALEANGIKVRLTRYDDEFYTLDERQDFARASGADLFVALHNNSSETPSLSGTEVYYYRANSQPLAKSIHSRLVNTWKNIYFDNSIMLEKVVPKDGGVWFYPFQVTRIEECPAVLVECGYLSNPIECNMLCAPENQTAIGQSVADGIIDNLRAQ